MFLTAKAAVLAASLAPATLPLVPPASRPLAPAPVIVPSAEGYRPSNDAADQIMAIDRFSIEIIAQGVQLWAGDLSVNQRTGASYEQRLVQPSLDCPINSDRYSVRSESSRLQVRLSNTGRSNGPDLFDLSVEWTRPLPDCRSDSSATVSFKRSVEVAPGKTAQVTGDAGLIVRLVRAQPKRIPSN